VADDLRTVRWLMGLILRVAFVASLEAVKEALDYGFTTYNFTHRASGPFGPDWRNANRAGIFYATFTPLFVALLLFGGPRWSWRIAGLVGAAAGTLAVFATYSRQAYLIVALGAFGLTLRRSVVAGVLLAAFIANYALWAPTTVVDRLEMTYQEDMTGEEQQLEVSAESRLIIWAGALECIKDHPLGIGFNRFKAEIGNYSAVQGMDAHSQYVLIATENGIQGLLAFLILVGGLIGIGLKLARMANDYEARVIGFGFTAAAICFALGNIYGSPFFFGEAVGNFWALAALVARYTSLREPEFAAAEQPTPETGAPAAS
jgi:O-antigen ligase